MFAIKESNGPHAIDQTDQKTILPYFGRL